MKKSKYLLIPLVLCLAGCATEPKVRQTVYSNEPFFLSNKNIAIVNAVADSPAKIFATKLSYYLNSYERVKIYQPNAAIKYGAEYHLTIRKAAESHVHSDLIDNRFAEFMDLMPVDYLLLVWIGKVEKITVEKKGDAFGGKSVDYSIECAALAYDCNIKKKLRFFSYKGKYHKSRACLGSIMMRSDRITDKEYIEFLDKCSADIASQLVKSFP